jgi:dihydroorotate dehydrogenase subfamily 2
VVYNKRQLLKFTYKNILRPLLFLLDAEKVHNLFIDFGQFIGSNQIGINTTRSLFHFQNKKLKQEISGVTYENPIGLAAGFDYNAKLTQILSKVGFGFASAGTITNMPYEGNPAPRLGRLQKSKSLLVNKGFKSDGADSVFGRLKAYKFKIPVGISIGRTNSAQLNTVEKSIKDIVSAFKKAEKANIRNAYYELNISCPNLIHISEEISFYPTKNLQRLLKEIDKLKIRKSVFIKMPISENNKRTLGMLKVIEKHNIVGVIFGNLEKNRKNTRFDSSEIKNAGKGNFSGKPCYERSNELISLAYKHYKNKLIIVGCGGVFGAEDAYEKIKRGASLIQLITGMVFEGPQLIGEINSGLTKLIKKDGYKSIKGAVGSYYK